MVTGVRNVTSIIDNNPSAPTRNLAVTRTLLTDPSARIQVLMKRDVFPSTFLLKNVDGRETRIADRVQLSDINVLLDGFWLLYLLQ